MSFDAVAPWLQTYPLTTILFGIGTALFLLARFRRQSLNLPRFEVTSEVLQTIEEAHAQVPHPGPHCPPRLQTTTDYRIVSR